MAIGKKQRTNSKHREEKWKWQREQQQSFDTLKEKLTSPPILAYPDFMQREAMFKVREKRCSFNQTVYEKDRDSFNCQSSINVYHCIQNERNRSGEICIQPVWVQPNYCPEYNTGANTLDTVPCNESITGSCPHALFLSNEVYKCKILNN
uniref:Uncharacterized protein n=1 Tax=Magallana gigas TaxID=29159 RepID=K1QV68_MAGGI